MLASVFGRFIGFVLSPAFWLIIGGSYWGRKRFRAMQVEQKKALEKREEEARDRAARDAEAKAAREQLLASMTATERALFLQQEEANRQQAETNRLLREANDRQSRMAVMQAVEGWNIFQMRRRR